MGNKAAKNRVYQDIFQRLQVCPEGVPTALPHRQQPEIFDFEIEPPPPITTTTNARTAFDNVPPPVPALPPRFMVKRDKQPREPASLRSGHISSQICSDCKGKLIVPQVRTTAALNARCHLMRTKGSKCVCHAMLHVEKCSDIVSFVRRASANGWTQRMQTTCHVPCAISNSMSNS